MALPQRGAATADSNATTRDTNADAHRRSNSYRHAVTDYRATTWRRLVIRGENRTSFVELSLTAGCRQPTAGPGPSRQPRFARVCLAMVARDVRVSRSARYGLDRFEWLRGLGQYAP